MRLFSTRLALCMLAAASVSSAAAGTISFTNQTVDLNGTGFGNVLRILAVHANNSEFGSVLWDGSDDVLSGDATNQSMTLTADVLATNGVTGPAFSLIANIGEPGNGTSIILHDFAMRFQDSTGSMLFPDLVFDAPDGGIELDQVSGGIGGAGWRFLVTLTPGESASFFGTATNRVGMLIEEGQAIELSGGTAENFFVAPVPEPTTLSLALLAGLAAIIRVSGASRSKRQG